MKKLVALFLGIIGMGISGYSHAASFLQFEGQLDFSKDQIEMAFNFPSSSISPQVATNTIIAKAKKTSPNSYQLSVDINQLKVSLFELKSNIESSIEINEMHPRNIETLKFKQGTEKVLTGKIWSQYSLLDFKPINELSGNFEVRGKTLYIDALSVGDITLNGSIDWNSPVSVDLKLGLDSISLADVSDTFLKEKIGKSFGDFSGEINFSGPIERLLLQGNLESKNGFINKISYDDLKLNFSGVYPIIQVTESSIEQTGGMNLALEGVLDLKEKENIKQQFANLTLKPIVNNSDSKKEWTIKKFRNEDSSSTELKYMLRKEGEDLEDDMDMIGIERSMKF